MTPEELHYRLIRHVIDTGHAPDLASLPDSGDAVQKLNAMRGIVLEPQGTRLWTVHPFALNPTAFWVTAGNRSWWANCAWCSLGIGAALAQDIAISTRDGGEGAALEFRIEDGVSSRPDLFIHFPYPPERWWDNPYCPCGNILFFTSEASVAAWALRHGRPQGSVMPIETGIRLAQLWFGDYASPDWRRKTADQAKRIFEDLHLDPAFWKLP
jgi:hypothetical protein